MQDEHTILLIIFLILYTAFGYIVFHVISCKIEKQVQEQLLKAFRNQFELLHREIKRANRRLREKIEKNKTRLEKICEESDETEFGFELENTFSLI
jgi:predicted PurR-regulated permease PerM